MLSNIFSFLNPFSKRNSKSVVFPFSFDNAPYLTPWYVTENKPSLVKAGKILKWKYFEKIRGEYAGLFTLRDDSDKLLGLVNMYNYILPSPDNSKFIIWNRTANNDLNPFITIQLHYVDKLMPLGLNRKDILDFSKSKDFYLFSDKPIATMTYFIDPLLKEDNFIFPEEFKIFNCFLAVCNIKGLYGDLKEFGSTAILEFNPRLGTIKYFPQHWFNKSNADFGYEWITRAVRDRNGIIHGQGIRISDFILDDTGCELRR
jgi:hypothetical protein